MNSNLIAALNIVITGNLAALVECGKSVPNSTCALRASTLLVNFQAAPMNARGVPLVTMVIGTLPLLYDCNDTTEAQKLNIDNALKKLDEYLPLIQAIEPGEEPTREQELTKNEPLTRDSDLTMLDSVGRGLALEATWAIEPLCDELLNQIPEVNVDTDCMQPCAVMETLALRIKALNSVLMSGLSGPDITLWQAARVVYSQRANERLDSDLKEAAKPAKEDDYMAGVNSAIEMLTKAHTRDGDKMELDGTHRPGHRQDNFALAYLKAVMSKPETAEGFASVLSAIIGPNILDKGYVKEFAALDYDRMIVPTVLRHPETGLLPGEKFPDSETSAPPVPKAKAKPKVKANKTPVAA